MASKPEDSEMVTSQAVKKSGARKERESGKRREKLERKSIDNTPYDFVAEVTVDVVNKAKISKLHRKIVFILAFIRKHFHFIPTQRVAVMTPK